MGGKVSICICRFSIPSLFAAVVLTWSGATPAIAGLTGVVNGDFENQRAAYDASGGYLFSVDYPGMVQSLAPLAYWRLNEMTPVPVDTATNSVAGGAALNGVYSGYSARSPVDGALNQDANQAQAFNGVGNYLNIPYREQLNQHSNWSAEIWMKPTQQAGGNAASLFSSGTPGNVTDRKGWVFYVIDNGNAKNDLSLRPYIGSAITTVTGTATGLTIPNIITANVWHHVVVVNDGTSFQVYLDGAMVGSTSAAGYVEGTTGTAIGLRLGAANYFSGALDECAFYTNAVSAAQVLAHYDDGVNRTGAYDALVTGDGAVAYYRLDEPAFAPVLPTAENSANGVASLGAAANGTYSAGTATASAGLPNPPNTGLGIDNVACYLDGTGNIDCGNNVGFNVSALSIAAWVKSDGILAYMNILAKGGVLWRLNLNNTDNTLAWVVPGGGANGTKGVADGNWHHVVATADGSGSALYVDGVLDATGAGFNGSANADNVRIGSQGNASAYMWKGSLDEVALFGAKLTEQNVADLYASRLNVPTPTNGSYWAAGSGGGGPGIWSSTSANWAASPGTQGTLPQRSGATLIFGDSAGAVAIDGTVSANAGLQFTASGYSLGPGSSTPQLGLAGANAAANSITVDPAMTATIGAAITGSHGMSKAGAGTLILGGANACTGDTTISAGTLKLTGGSLGNTDIKVVAGALAVQPGSATTISAGSTGPGSAGATLNLGNQTFDMTDGACSIFNLQQQSGFAGIALAISNGATLKFDLDGLNADLLAVAKAASVSGAVNVIVDTSGSTSLTPGTHNLITADSGLTAGGPTWQFTGGGTIRTVSVGGTNYLLTVLSADAAIRVSVAPVPNSTTTTLSSSASNSTYGASVVFTAEVSPAITGGTAQFYDNGVLFGSRAVSGGQALITNSLPAGTRRVTAEYSGYGEYAGSISAALTQTVNQATLTISIATVLSRTYNGNTNATITGDLSGVLPGDAGLVTLVGGGGFASAGVSNGIAVAARCSLAGAKAGNYVLTQPAGLTGNITPALLTVKAEDKIRLRGAANPPLTYTITGYQNGENATTAGVTGAPALSTSADAASMQGVYIITCATGSLGGASNYAYALSNGTLTIIDTLTWTAGSGNWDLASLNWKNLLLAYATNFTDGVAVLFNDTPSGSGPYTVTATTAVNPGGVTVSNVTKDYIFTGSGISSTNGLLKQGAGKLKLSVANNYSGGTTVTNGGTLVLGNKNGLGSGTMSLDGGTAFHTSFEGNVAGGALPNAFILSGGTANGGRVTTDVSFGNKDIWINTAVSGPGGFNVTGSDQRNPGLMLDGVKTFAGGVTLGFGAGVSINNAASLGTGTLRGEGGLLIIKSDLSAGVANSAVIAQGKNLRVQCDNPVKLTGVISDEGAGGNLVKSGTAMMTLSGSNTYAGTTTINAGTLTLTNSLALQNSTLVYASGTLALAGGITNYTLGGLSGDKDIALSNADGAPVALSVGKNNSSTAHSGALTGPGSLTKMGSGTLALSGANSYTGNTVVAAGVLSISRAYLSDNADVSLSGGGALDLAFSGEDTIGALLDNNVEQMSGIYGPGALGGRITGSGFLRVTKGPMNGSCLIVR